MERDNESFNEKCDRVLRYLKQRPSHFTEITTWTKFTNDTGINSSDPVISFLYREKNFIGMTKHDVYIEAAGVAFIETSSLHKIQQDADLESSLLWYNHADAKQRFEDYPKVKKQRDVAYIITIISVLVAIAALIFKK